MKVDYNQQADELVQMILATGYAPAILSAIDEAEEKARCEGSLAEFVKRAWQEIEPESSKLVWNWHLDVICAYMEGVADGRIKRLIINISPGTMKSLVVMVFYPAWTWAKKPGERFLCGTNDGTLATRDAVRMRQLVTSDWYQKHWGTKVELSSDQAEKGMFANTARGHRQSQSILAKVTGKRGSQLLWDDPHGASQIESDLQREEVLAQFDQSWSSRRNDLENSPIVIVMQRLHHMDITGHLMKQGGWTLLAIPMRYDPEITYDPVKDLGRPDLKDPRTKPGELMFPAKFSEKAVKELEQRLGSYGAAGQLQQRPSPKGGGIIQTDQIRLWPNNKPLPVMQFVLQSYDTAFTEKTHNDPTACTVWGVFWHEGRNNVMMIDCWQEHMEYPDLRKRVVKEWKTKYAGDPQDPANKARHPNLALIEKKGSGQSLLQDLAGTGIQLAEYNPGLADKTARAHVITPIIEAGMVWVKEGKAGDCWPSWAVWFENQLKRFPNDEHDDGVDTCTQALRYLKDAGFLIMTVSLREEDHPKPSPKEYKNVYAQ